MSAKIHFYIRHNRPSKEGSVQIFMLFLINRKQRLTISTGKFIPLKKEFRKLTQNEIQRMPASERENLFCWDHSKERTIRGAENWEAINTFLDNEKARANQVLLKYQMMKKPITLDLFEKAFLTPNATDNFFEYFTEELQRRKDILAPGTIRGYKGILSKIQTYRPKLVLGDIDYKFLTAFENYMRKPVSEKGLGNCQNTISRTMKAIRAFLQIAMKNGDFPKEAYPFYDYKIKHVDPVLTTRDYLEPEDLLKIEQLLSPEKINCLTKGEIKATKRFLFSCYTGLRFSDVNSLKRKEHIFNKWVHDPQTNEMTLKYYIEVRMTKTDQPVFIPLIDKAMELLNESTNDQVFEVISNEKVNQHLKSINNKAGLNKKLSFHVARHSFATICFLYGIPENVGQKLLGHKNRKFTEVYTHLSKNKLFYEMDKLNRGLNSFEILLDETDSKRNNVKEILPMIQNLNPDQIKGLIKLLGGGGNAA